MKTLYLTDLDGTFLNNEAKVSERSAEIINYLTEKGVRFTLATARTYSSVIPMFRGVKLELPLVLMNGVCIYDPKEHKTVSSVPIDDAAGEQLIKIFDSFQKTPMLYFEKDNELTVEYIHLNNDAERRYVSHRSELFQKALHRSSRSA